MKLKILTLSIIFLLLIAMPALAGQVTLKTYYPSPSGVYSKVRLMPQNLLSGACDTGTMYVDQQGFFHICGAIEQWDTGPAFAWKQVANDVFLVDTQKDVKVGINTTAPSSELEIKSATNTSVTLTTTAKGSNANLIKFNNSNRNNDWQISAQANSNFKIGNATDRLKITKDGAVTIPGTTTISGKTTIGGELWVNDGSSSGALQVVCSSNLCYPAYAP
ncbi:MAG: hypothetical protein P9X22_02875 [Candidatus Zapsychrus exili]|nr:hypothetical protein [Candidatus Zapsychrus exili]